MSLVPRSRVGKLQFFGSKIDPWSSNATAIGTTAAEVAALNTKIATANDAIASQVAAQQIAKNATLVADNAVQAVADAGSAIIAQIRARADATNNPGVYEIAQIPPPATPSPRPAPPACTDFTVELGGNGAVILKWKCRSGAGTIYQIYRAEGGSPTYAYVGGVGTKSFTDTAVAAGVTQLTYMVQAVRSTRLGPWSTFNVYFGSNASGGPTARLEEVPNVRAAA